MDLSSTALSSGLVGRLANPARETRGTLAILGQELATGEQVDKGNAVNHDFSALGLVARDLEVADSLRASINRGQRITGTAQAALGAIDVQLSSLREELVPLVSGGQADPAVLGDAAEGTFRKIVDLINTRQDDGAVFAAGRGDADAVGDADAILTDLRAAVVGATSPDEIRSRLETFFEPAGVFQTGHVTGGSPAEFSFRTESDRSEDFDIRASDARFADALRAVGTLLAVAESPYAEGPSGQVFMAIASTADLATAQDGVIEMAAETGRVEGRLSAAQEALQDRLVRAQQARQNLIGADPYETATRLQEETARLETIYTLTARLSNLRLTNFL